MIAPKTLKAFLFAFLCILSGGFLMVGSSVLPILVYAGGVLILFGLLIGFFSVGIG